MSRKIENKMVTFLDAKLASNGLAQHAMATKDARLLFGLAAEACVGIKEVGGNNQGPMVELIQETVGRAEGEPWCASFVQTCLAYAELKTGIQSPIFETEHVQTMWGKSKLQRVKFSPLKYAIVCWAYEDSSSGHTGILIENNRESYMRTVEGNTNADGHRDGNGVFFKKRSWIRDGKLIKLGFLIPFPRETK